MVVSSQSDSQIFGLSYIIYLSSYCYSECSYCFNNEERHSFLEFCVMYFIRYKNCFVRGLNFVQACMKSLYLDTLCNLVLFL